MKLNLLDCSLRDGGYVNDWNWGNANILYIFQKLQKAGVDIIEVGYLRENDKYNPDRAVFPNIECINDLFCGIKKNTKVSAMIDYGAISLENIKDNDNNFIDILRVTFKKHQSKEALKYCKELKKKGYDIFLQPVSVTSYNDKEMLDLIERVNDIKPIALSIVDSYGLAEEEKVIKYFYLMNYNLLPEIGIAYHSHNNFQLAYSNSTKILDIKCKRKLFFDASLYGIGKSAGNCNLELLAMHLNKNYNKNYNLSEILDIIDMKILQLAQKYQWGYQLPFFVSALNDCHPNYVHYLLKKNQITVKEINNIVEKIDNEKRLIFDKDYIEKLFTDHQRKIIDDKNSYEELALKFENKSILLLGPGASLMDEQEKIKEYIENNNLIKISVNHINKFFKTDYTFISNAKRFEQFSNIGIKKKSKFIITSNISDENGLCDYVLNFDDLYSSSTIIGGSSLYLLTNALIKLKAEKVILAGFDGFSKYTKNYYDNDYNFYFKQANISETTKAIVEQISKWQEHIKIEFLTKSKYQTNKEVDCD